LTRRFNLQFVAVLAFDLCEVIAQRYKALSSLYHVHILCNAVRSICCRGHNFSN